MINEKIEVTTGDVTIHATVLRTGKVITFAANNLEIKRTDFRTHAGMLVATDTEVKIEGVKYDSICLAKMAPIKQEPPKYFAAMGDAAQAYCDEFNSVTGGIRRDFRWEEVWKLMWEVNQQGNPNLKEDESN